MSLQVLRVANSRLDPPLSSTANCFTEPSIFASEDPSRAAWNAPAEIPAKRPEAAPFNSMASSDGLTILTSSDCAL